MSDFVTWRQEQRLGYKGVEDTSHLVLRILDSPKRRLTGNHFGSDGYVIT